MPDSSPFKYDKADDSAGFLLWKITMLWQRKLAEVFDKFDITQTQYALLASLKWFEEKKEPITQSHLVEHTKIEKMTVSKALQRLESSGLVLRKTAIRDNRAINVCFTAQGRRLIKRAILAVENADVEFFSCLTEKQLGAYRLLTSTVIQKNDA